MSLYELESCMCEGSGWAAAVAGASLASAVG